MKYALLDSAILEGHRHFGLQQAVFAKSLFIGRTGELMDSVAPYLMQINDDKKFLTWFVHTGMYDKGGILINSNAKFDDLHHHLRKFLYVKTEDKDKLYFRFYDPRVLPTFLRTCDKEQLNEFFGPVNIFSAFKDTETSLLFRFDGQKLAEQEQTFDPLQYPFDLKEIYNIEENKLT